MANSVMTCGEFQKALENGKVKIGEFTEKMKLAPVTIDGNLVRIQTPEMTTPFGASPPYNPSQNKNKDKNDVDPNANFSMDLSFVDQDKRKSLSTFKKCINELGELVIKKGVERSSAWFNKNYSEEMIRDFYKSNIRDGNEKYSSTFRMTLHRVNGQFVFSACDNDYNPINLMDTPTKGAKVTAILRCNGVWTVGKTFGISWKVEQLRVVPSVKFQGFVFREDVDRIATPEMIESADPEKKRNASSTEEIYNEDVDEPQAMLEKKKDQMDTDMGKPMV